MTTPAGASARTSPARELREQNRVRVETIRAHRLDHVERRERQRARLMEALSVDWVTPYADLLDRYRNTGDPLFVGPATYWQRRGGQDYPIYRTEQELALLRAPARLLAATSAYAQGMVGGLSAYVISTGAQYRAAAKRKGADVPPGLLAACQEVIDRTLERNQWRGGEQPPLEPELFARSLEDGEFLLVHYPRDDGWTDFRTAEPEQLTEPPPDVLADGEDGRFGTITPRDDVQQTLGHWLQWGDSREEGERYDPDRVTHYRRNVKRSMKRGLPDFSFDALEAIRLAGVLRGNLGDGAAQQAAIVGVRQHQAGTQEQIQRFVDDMAAYTEPDALTGTRTPVRRARGGSWEDIPAGLAYVAGPGATNAPAHLQILQACLRGAVVKWNGFEWLISADASNNNYASSLTAESPFVRRVLMEQAGYRAAFRKPVVFALRHYVETHGGLDDGVGRRWAWPEIAAAVDVLVELPSPETRDKAGEATRAATEIPLGVDSRQQYCQRQGRDFDQVEADNAAYATAHPPAPATPWADPAAGLTGLEGDAEVPDAVARALLEDGYTGVITDSLGRRRRYVNGRQVAAAAVGAAGKAAGAAGAAAARLDAAAGDSRLGPLYRLGKAGVHKVEAGMSALMKQTQKLAAQAARERGLSTDHVARVARVTAAIDFAASFALSKGAAVASGGNPVVGFAAGMLPTASVAYLAYSTARDPGATLRAARAYLAGKIETPAGHARHESEEPDREALLFGYFDKAADPDWAEAVLAAALDEAGHDLAAAVAAAGKVLAAHPHAPGV